MIGTYVIAKEQEGQRLDVALSSFFPALSLREVRRAWGLYLVELNHKHARKGMFVKAGDEVTITAIPQEGKDSPEVGFLPGQSAQLGQPAQLTQPGQAHSSKVNGQIGKIAAPQIYAENSQTSILSPSSFSSKASQSSQIPCGNQPSHLFEQKNKQVSAQTYPHPDLSALRILHRENGVMAIFKPAGLHSASVQGGGLSLEQLLPDLCAKADIDPITVELFNRLDCLTSGIVLATENASSRQISLQAEKAGKIEKRYLALVRGNVFGEFWIKNALDTDSRRKTKVLSQINPDPLRHTLVRPVHLFSDLSYFFPSLVPNSANSNLCNLEYLSPELEPGQTGGRPKDLPGVGPGERGEQPSGQAGNWADEHIAEEISQQNKNQKSCLLEVTIFQGARHQIRAHLASVGFPILGDPLYDPAYENSMQGLYLHHFATSLPGFLCITPPPWPIQNVLANNKVKLERIIKGLFPGLYSFV